MTAGSPRASTAGHPTLRAAMIRQETRILALFAEGRSLDYVCEVGASEGWTRARAIAVRDQHPAPAVVPMQRPATSPRTAPAPAAAKRDPRIVAAGNLRRVQALPVDHLLGEADRHASTHVRKIAARIWQLVDDLRVALPAADADAEAARLRIAELEREARHLRDQLRTPHRRHTDRHES